MTTEHQKAWKGVGMEGWIARSYARTRRKDIDQFRGEARKVAEHLPAGAGVLEVAPGPGFFSVELAKLGNFKLTGLDVSRTFIGIAQENARAEGVTVDFRFGSASAMPFPGESFDFVYCSAAFKNFSEPVKALDEMHRVLRPGGEAMIVDLAREVPVKAIKDYVAQSGRSGFESWMMKQTLRWLQRRAYTEAEFSRMAEESRFGGCKISMGAIGFEVRLMKQKA